MNGTDWVTLLLSIESSILDIGFSLCICKKRENMFKFKLGRKQPEENEARRRLQKELFGLTKVIVFDDGAFEVRNDRRLLLFPTEDLRSWFSVAAIGSRLRSSAETDRYRHAYG